MFEPIIVTFNAVFFAPIVNLLILIYKLLELAHIPGALGFAIILLTLGIRLLLWPVTRAQLKSAQKMSAMKPHLDELKKKHKDDKAALSKAQMDLYKQHGINPAAGCLPALVQIPIFIALYQSIINVFPGPGAHIDKINAVLYNSWLHLSQSPNLDFFGLNLGIKPSDFGHVGILILLIPIITGLLTFIQSKMMLPAKPLKIYPDDKPKEIKEKEGMEDAMAGMQTQMVYLMPVMIGYFAFQFPAGLALYWNTFTILGIIQQYKVSGWGGMADIVGRFKVTSNK